jgi:hypothetical protein
MSLRRKPPVGNVRRVRSIGKNLRGVVTSKTGRSIQFESFAERTLILCLDRDHTVADYNSQPETFTFHVTATKTRHYTPDFIVWRTDGTTEIHEVTRTERQDTPRIHLREEAARTICRDRGWQYIVHTEATLPCPTETANLLGLWVYRPTIYNNPLIRTETARYLVETGCVSWNVLTTQLAVSFPGIAVNPTLLHMLWHNLLATDLKQLLWQNGELVTEQSVWWSGVSNDR